MPSAPSRREFITTVAGGGLGALAALRARGETAASAALPESPPLPAIPRFRPKQPIIQYRAASWWLEWDDLIWPSGPVADKVRRRADLWAGTGVNCGIIFGTHFRWDFLPLWNRVHGLIQFIAEELHQRDILLFDHHSSVLTHRPRTTADALDIWKRNRHHVPFFPSREAAQTWEFNGTRLNDWRMIDVATGEPAYTTAYRAEQFCMNNPAFQAAYAAYVQKLLRETGIDGLMSDDAIYYTHWSACGCEHCRARFRRDYGRELPPTTDSGFWGNWSNDAFKDWIELRFHTSGDFLVKVREALPAGFPLMSCCSSSDGQIMPSVGMSYQDFMRGCNVVMLEMTGLTPSLAGTWLERVPSQLLHVSIAHAYDVPCIGLGYGHFPDSAFLVWALNKFLGTGCWFSTLKGRLSGNADEIRALADDGELVAEGYRWERDHPRLFTGEVDADVAVFFSRDTRDFYAQYEEDYVQDYHASCLRLLEAGIAYEIATDIPQPGRIRVLILSSAICLSAALRAKLQSFLEAGGLVIATGPTGNRDARAHPAASPWLASFGLAVEVTEPVRKSGFPPPEGSGHPPQNRVAECRLTGPAPAGSAGGWCEIAVGRGQLLWRPERMGLAATAEALVSRMNGHPAPGGLDLRAAPAGWQTRRYADGDRILFHGLPTRVVCSLRTTLKNEFTHEPVIEALQYAPLSGALTVAGSRRLKSLALHSPDLAEPRAGKPDNASDPNSAWSVDCAGVRRYFILECRG